MIELSKVLFWISLVIFIITIVSLLYIFKKKNDQKLIIYVATLMIASVVVTITQQLGIIYGTRSGDISFFSRYFVNIIGVVFFIGLLAYISVLLIKLSRCQKLKINNNENIGEDE